MKPPASPAMPADSGSDETIFAAALQWENPAQRAAYLDEACAGNPDQRRRVEELLQASGEAQTFLERPVGQPRRPGPTAAAAPTIRFDVLGASPVEGPGARIGRYKLLQQIGEGGCGTVFMAEQEEPVRRRVALKVIKLGMDTKSVIARFEAERQALALMDHPNIARVLDAGATDSGRPFFVMELVRGIPITRYCDEHKLDTGQRLDLFIRVCHAIQHAHQKGIIHRDIKPSNILVTLHDGVPVPKVIDFGIAKATEGRLTNQTLFTAFEQFIGTPAYMSPEQAEMSGLDIDTRSDIYSLGVLLYEMLTGRTPFDAKELMAQGIDAMRKTIREREPARPSVRLATLPGKELTTAALRHSADTAKLTMLLRGDLDWIVMKCLEKDRTRRYETANGLAADLKRHLDHEPVTARPPSAAYRFQKAWRRNRVTYTAGAVVGLVVVTGLLLVALEFRRTAKAQAEVLRESLRADDVAASMLEMLNTTIPGLYYRGNLKEGEALMQRADALAHALSNAPAAELSIRLANKEFYDEYFNDWKRAKLQADRVLELLPKVADAQLPPWTSRLILTSERFGYLLWTSDDPRDHEEGRRLMELGFQEAKAFPLDDAAARVRATVGAWDLNVGDYERALPLLEEGLRHLPPGPGSMVHYWVRHDLAMTHYLLGNPNRACDLFLESLKLPKDNAPITQVFLIRNFETGNSLLSKLGRGREYEQGIRELEGGLRELRYPKQVLAYLRALRGLTLLESDPARQSEGRRLVDEAADEVDTGYASWRIATTVAAGLEGPNRYTQLKRRGIRSFASGTDVAGRIELTWLLLLRDPSEFEIKLCQDLVSELEQRFSEQPHHSVVRLPALRALLACRQKDFRAALKEVEKPAPVRKDIPVVARRLKEDREPDRWVVRALAYAALGERDEARLALEKGRAALGTEVEWEPGVFLSIKLLAREAERTIGSESGNKHASARE